MLHSGAATKVIRAIHRVSGGRAVIKMPLADSPNSRVVGWLLTQTGAIIGTPFYIAPVGTGKRGRGHRHFDNVRVCVVTLRSYSSDAFAWIPQSAQGRKRLR